MFISEAIDALRERRLEIDCVEMTLTQVGASDPIWYRGKGYIRQAEDDTLKFKIFVVETNYNFWGYLRAHISDKSGRVYSDNDYFILSAKAIDGTIWKAERILPNFHWLAQNKEPIVDGAVSSLCTISDAEGSPHTLRMLFFENVDLPWIAVSKTETDAGTTFTRNASRFSAVGVRFVVQKTERGFSVQVTSDTQLHEHLATRIQEALRYLLAKTVSWRVTAERLRRGLPCRSH